jgi:RepB plasmid partitioning protein
LLVGICTEVAEILKNKRVAPEVFAVLKKAKALRQIEIAELLVAASNCSVPYTKALLAATPPEMLVDPDRNKVAEGLCPNRW